MSPLARLVVCVRWSSCVQPAAKLLQPLRWLDCIVAIFPCLSLAGELLLSVPTEVRATALFGKASELLRAVAVGEVSPLPLSPEGRARWDAVKKFLQQSIIGRYVGFRLAVEAVAFGASLFDAEDWLRSTHRTWLFAMQMRCQKYAVARPPSRCAMSPARHAVICCPCCFDSGAGGGRGTALHTYLL